MWSDLELFALVSVDPDEQFRVLFGTDAVRDSVSTILSQTLFLGDHFETSVADGQFHVEPSGRTYNAHACRCIHKYMQRLERNANALTWSRKNVESAAVSAAASAARTNAIIYSSVMERE